MKSETGEDTVQTPAAAGAGVSGAISLVALDNCATHTVQSKPKVGDSL